LASNAALSPNEPTAPRVCDEVPIWTYGNLSLLQVSRAQLMNEHS
jgi:hypothetical protein